MVTADRFARVLDASGFRRDAIDVAIAGDDPGFGEETARRTFEDLFGGDLDFKGYTAEDLRYALAAFAAGQSLESLKWEMGSTLYSLFQKHLAKLSSEDALKKISKEVSDVYEVEEDALPAVFGASLVHFPKIRRRKRLLPSRPETWASPGSGRSH
jgi:hypothetical protein